MTSIRSYDLFVIGTGPAGQRAAVQATKLGQKVGICDRRELVGGVCINTGTIPSKTFREAVLYLSGLRQRLVYGKAYTVKEDITMHDLVFRVDQVIQREVNVVRDQMRRNRIELIGGTASFNGPNELLIEGVQGSVIVQARHVLIATGTQPAAPAGIKLDGVTAITSDEVLRLARLPRSMTVVGAGVIGTEYASMFAALGVEITLIDLRPRLLEFVDAEISDALAYHLRDMDCTLRLQEEVASVTVEGPQRVLANLKSGKRVVSEVLLYSTGRLGATGELKLEAAGLEADSRGRLVVNEHYQTSVPHIYAAGDVVGYPSLASTSMEQGRHAACHAFGVPYKAMPNLFPYGIYSVPEISMVGPTEEQLTKQGVTYEVGVARYREIARGAILGDDTGLLKLLFDQDSRRLLGVHIIGTSATELVHIGQAVMAFDGTIDYFVNAVFNYPTFAECYKVAALDAYNKLGPPPQETPPPPANVTP